MSFWNDEPYVSAKEKKKKRDQLVAKKKKKGEHLSPVEIEGRQIAKTFWGKSWCEHLENFSDYDNRLPRGRTYARNGSIIHLEINTNKIKAFVYGSSLYEVQVEVKSVPQKKWQSILEICSGEIGSIIELLQGKLSSSIMAILTDKKNGLFPLENEMKFSCSCPDWAGMCKHIAAVLYGVGARLDQAPELLFTLRNVPYSDLVNKATEQTLTRPKSRTSKNIIKDQDLSDLFGIDLDIADASKNVLVESATDKTKNKSTKKLVKKKILKKKILKKKVLKKKILKKQ